MRVYNSKTNIKANYQEGIPHFVIRVDFESRIDATQCKEDLTDIQAILKLEKRTQEFVERELRATIEKLQKEFQVDIFGFG